MNVSEQLKAQWRLLLFTGIMFGLAVVFAVLQPYQSTASTVRSQQPAVTLEPIKPKPWEFPKGGRLLLPDYRLVALYGNTDSRGLGSFGEQPPEQAAVRIRELAAQYQHYSKEPVYPAFEIIATVASAAPTEDGNYSRETPVSKLKPVIELAKAQNIYVLLDLQPGYSDFLTQAKLYEELLKEPHVGLALDPEWRLKPGQRHLKQIGTVTSAEINATAAWLADLVKSHDLPQKMMLLHQFKLSMISERETLDTSRSELAWCIQMDGLGNQQVKQDSWRVVRSNAPAGIHFGWKNFYDEDKPMLTPEQTFAIEPKPLFVSYQ